MNQIINKDSVGRQENFITVDLFLHFMYSCDVSCGYYTGDDPQSTPNLQCFDTFHGHSVDLINDRSASTQYISHVHDFQIYIYKCCNLFHLLASSRSSRKSSPTINHFHFTNASLFLLAKHILRPKLRETQIFQLISVAFRLQSMNILS